MSRELIKENVIQNKKRSIKLFNNMLEGLINDPSGKLLKKADLLSYWLKDFAFYIQHEESFDSTRLISYKRGDVIRINFGFNVGKEFGGLHYAVVIDNDNKHNADVITVIPLSSTDGRKIHARNVDLGSEIYTKVIAVQDGLLKKAKDALVDIKTLEDAFSDAVSLIKNGAAEDDFDISTSQVRSAFEAKQNLENKRKEIIKSISIIERNNTEIKKLKYGGMAIPNQIRTLSKQRIYTPKKSEDFLYGISLSASAMDKIDEKLRELFLFK